MRCTFVAMGWENISVQCLSAILKANGHEVTLAYDQSLFDDKNYLCIPKIAKIFDMKKRVLHQVIESKPDLVAFSVMTTTYRWALDMAREIKKYLDVPIIFGGIHPSSVPEKVIREEPVDIVCVGEGEYALLELCNSIEQGEIDFAIKGMWFKTPGGKIIRNPMRPQIVNLDELPMVDKELFARHVPIKNYYLSVIARGCPFNCSYCSLSFEAKEWEKIGGKRFRERSVDSVIAELKRHKELYSYKWIDFRHSVMSASTHWIVDFCNKYKKDINVPFRIFWHPGLITEEAAFALKNANCHVVQLGLESYDEDIRNRILNRKVTTEQFHKAVNILEKYKLRYSLDYILGLPGQTEEELINFAEFLANLKYCYRVSSFMLQYLPQTDIIRYGLEHNQINETEIDRLEEGYHDTYMVDGSVSLNKEILRIMNSFRILYRLMSLSPPFLKKSLVRYRIYKAFRFLPPRLAILILDTLMGFRDMDGRTYAWNYLWWISKRFDASNPACMFRKLPEKKPIVLPKNRRFYPAKSSIPEGLPSKMQIG